MDPRLPTPWMPPPPTHAAISRVYYEHLRQPNLSALSSWIASSDFGRLPDRPNVALYGDVMLDLTRLIEEFRFEMAAGAMYSIGLESELEKLSATQADGFAALGMPSSVRAVLSGYAAPVPLPLELLMNPAMSIPGTHLLGGWWAAQLFDSALVRGLSAMDRLAALLCCVDGGKVNPDWPPAMRPKTLSSLVRWKDSNEVAELRKLITGEIYDFVLTMRDSLVHRRRKPMVLHGDHITFRTRDDGVEERVTGITSDDQLALGLAFYNDTLVPACALVGRMIAPDYTGESRD